MNRQLRKITAVVSAAAVALSGMSFGSLCLTAYAEGDGIQTALDVSKGSITITDSSVSGYAGDGTSVTKIDPDGYIITGTTTEYTVTVSGTQNITLDGVDIDVSNKSDTCAFAIEYNNAGNVTITLADGSVNTLQSGQSCAGLQKNEWDAVVGKLTIKGGEKGTGSLTAIGGPYSAGIGGGYETAASNIEISGGIVSAYGCDYGAGIGGGGGELGGYGIDITISGGVVTAQGGGEAAGIGGGGSWGTYDDGEGGLFYQPGADGSNIIITGGSVKAVAGAGANAFGGGARNYAVTPTDGTNNVYLLELEAAENTLIIDSKDYPINHGADGKIYAYLAEGTHTVVTDGTAVTSIYDKNDDDKLGVISTALTASSTNGGTLTYGVDYTYVNGVLKIRTDTPITLSGETDTDTIVVEKDKDANITLNGLNINVSATDDLCAFKIEDESSGKVTITLADDSVNTLKSGTNCAGLQKNGKSNNGILTIQGGEKGTGSLTATGGTYGAGIGGGNGSACGIYITGGTVTANGGYCGAGIGGGYEFSGSDIMISGGTVTANGGDYSAGIGGGGIDLNSSKTGDLCTGSNIRISGGIVTATGSDYGAGIGGGRWGNGDNIMIYGGSVKVNAGTFANALGGGYGMDAYYPVNSSNETVFLLTIANSGNDEITIDGKKYPTHSDGSCYAYLTAGTEHFVRIGIAMTTTVYTYDTEAEEWCNAVLPFSTSVAAHSLLLGDSIGVKFYMELSDYLLTDDAAVMKFTVNGKETVIPVSEAQEASVDDKTVYVFTCYAAAAEMTDVISARISTGEYNGEVYTYSVQDYARIILENPANFSEYVPVVKAMLNYGAAAQEYFGHNTITLANSILDEGDRTTASVTLSELEAYKMTFSDKDADINFVGYVISLKSKITAKLYFSGKDLTTEDFTVLVDEKAIDSSRLSVGSDSKGMYLAISDIIAGDFDRSFTVKAGGITIDNFSVYSYLRRCVKDNRTDLLGLVDSLYAYNEAVEAIAA